MAILSIHLSVSSPSLCFCRKGRGSVCCSTIFCLYIQCCFLFVHSVLFSVCTSSTIFCLYIQYYFLSVHSVLFFVCTFSTIFCLYIQYYFLSVHSVLFCVCIFSEQHIPFEVCISFTHNCTTQIFNSFGGRGLVFLQRQNVCCQIHDVKGTRWTPSVVFCL